MIINPFPVEDFNDWASTYDNTVVVDRFPFIGYTNVLTKILTLTHPHSGTSVLDLGTGTGNLAELFHQAGCKIWCIDFSGAMLAKAHQKIPSAPFFLHDLHDPLPIGLEGRPDYPPTNDRPTVPFPEFPSRFGKT